MKLKTWRKHHKWFGLIMGFFLVMFCWSGIVLNHRDAVSGLELSRSSLPGSYQYSSWNNGLVRGVAAADGGCQFIYGNAGVFSADSSFRCVRQLNEGFPDGVDNRNVRSMLLTRGMTLALTTQGLYRLTSDSSWREVAVLPCDERYSDMVIAGDTLVVVGRSRLYVSSLSSDSATAFGCVTLPAPDGYDGKVSLYKTIWGIHSGGIFGSVGKVIMDSIAVILILLYLSGLIYWFATNRIKHRKKSVKPSALLVGSMRASLISHDIIGRKTILFTIFICLTGWCLRPPLMIAGILTRVPPLPFTALDDPNAWADKLRALRYDSLAGDWLLSTSDGFYSMKTLSSVPQKLEDAPPVSIMGVNVFRRGGGEEWLVGSFRGLYRWDRSSGGVYDFYDGTRPKKSGMPVGEHDVCGWMLGPVEYTSGTSVAPMPDALAALPMSLWNFALEVHTGRIYTFMGSLSTLLWVFLAGAAALWVLWSGWKIRRGK